MKKFYLIISLFVGLISWGQNIALQGKVIDKNGKPLANVMVLQNYVKLTETNEKGLFLLTNQQFKPTKNVEFFLDNYQLKEIKLNKTQSIQTITLNDLSYNLSEVVIKKRYARFKNLRTLKDVEGTTVNAGRKNEVVLLNDLTINKVTNNARQIFSKVVGLTINESSDGGLQLNIGGRGLNPNRTANFNTRQNGYDISADVLGYPESYYTPPAEAVSEIQVIRGASSLQYGTQFGGMVNFKMNQVKFAVRNAIWRNGKF